MLRTPVRQEVLAEGLQTAAAAVTKGLDFKTFRGAGLVWRSGITWMRLWLIWLGRWIDWGDCSGRWCCPPNQQRLKAHSAGTSWSGQQTGAFVLWFRNRSFEVSGHLCQVPWWQNIHKLKSI
jgi:hypothetical protein